MYPVPNPFWEHPFFPTSVPRPLAHTPPHQRPMTQQSEAPTEMPSLASLGIFLPGMELPPHLQPQPASSSTQVQGTEATTNPHERHCEQCWIELSHRWVAIDPRYYFCSAKCAWYGSCRMRVRLLPDAKAYLHSACRKEEEEEEEEEKEKERKLAANAGFVLNREDGYFERTRWVDGKWVVQKREVARGVGKGKEKAEENGNGDGKEEEKRKGMGKEKVIPRPQDERLDRVSSGMGMRFPRFHYDEDKEEIIKKEDEESGVKEEDDESEDEEEESEEDEGEETIVPQSTPRGKNYFKNRKAKERRKRAVAIIQNPTQLPICFLHARHNCPDPQCLAEDEAFAAWENDHGSGSGSGNRGGVMTPSMSVGSTGGINGSINGMVNGHVNGNINGSGNGNGTVNAVGNGNGSGFVNGSGTENGSGQSKKNRTRERQRENRRQKARRKNAQKRAGINPEAREFVPHD
ncbi:hypothetical protein K491DRAFT_679906 [Lophiostoma macrostomum CBS 122681]|uniref:Uncharacterized protein n=1 Tax=Lophiostoma macrostomum CBS 122681 TaxID=1314788 RepID=A0A6A6T3E9_9PLEO|nr:hypothetical protein K491DRAFT_679906 [Lophiostoma macrostomum CBS 122681]